MDDRITRKTFLPLYLANGVTGLRNMHADCRVPLAIGRVGPQFEATRPGI